MNKSKATTLFGPPDPGQQATCLHNMKSYVGGTGNWWCIRCGVQETEQYRQQEISFSLLHAPEQWSSQYLSIHDPKTWKPLDKP